MNSEKNIIKVDSYDYFGYLIPGVIVLLSLIMLHLQFFKCPFFHTFPSIIYLMEIDIKTYQYITLIALALLASYVLGHIIASIASFFFEKVIIKNIIGYPYEILVLNQEQQTSSTSKHFQTIAIVVYAAILTFILQPKETIHILTDNVYISTLSIIALFFARKLPNWLFTAITWIPSHVFLYIERTVRLFIGHEKPLPQQLRDKIKSNFHKYFQLNIDDIHSEIYWATYWKVTQNDPYVRSKIDKWLILYSFLRNLACSFLISSIIISIPRINEPDSPLMTIHAVVLFVTSIITAIRYYYLYYSYYSKSIFRTFAYLPLQQDQDHPSDQ